MEVVNISKRSSDVIENKIIKSILDGVYKVGNPLPPERELANSLGVGRPTLREVLQRLEKDGWIKNNKGQPAIINNYWREANLNILVNIINNQKELTTNFIVHLLDFRALIVPEYVRDAVINQPAKVVSLIANYEDLEDDASIFAQFDWDLQKKIAHLANNPLYLLILNSFDDIYIRLANKYFQNKENRKSSLVFYENLLSSAMKGDGELAKKTTMEAMKKCICYWKKSEEEE